MSEALPTWRRILSSRHVREWGLIAAVAAGYSFLRWVVTPATPVRAVANAVDVVALERSLGLFVEQALQAPVLAHDWLVWSLNGYYILLHLPPIFAVLVYTYRVRPDKWPFVRDLMIGFTVAGLFIHAFFPLAPPWFMDGLGIQDTFADYRTDPLSQTSAGNPFAAMPSMHFGWALGAGVLFAVLGRSWWLRAFGVAHPVIMGVAIVVTGNHYVLDAVASVLLLGLAAGGVVLLHRRFPPLTQAAPDAPRRPPDPSAASPRP